MYCGDTLLMASKRSVLCSYRIRSRFISCCSIKIYPLLLFCDVLFKLFWEGCRNSTGLSRPFLPLFPSALCPPSPFYRPVLNFKLAALSLFSTSHYRYWSIDQNLSTRELCEKKKKRFSFLLFLSSWSYKALLLVRRRKSVFESV